jgi:hypothetical protein
MGEIYLTASLLMPGVPGRTDSLLCGFGDHQNKIERISMLRRGGASGGLVGSSKAL